jgi:hypothetical protein
MQGTVAVVPYAAISDESGTARWYYFLVLRYDRWLHAKFELDILADQDGRRIENLFLCLRVQREFFGEARMFRQFFFLCCGS